MRPSQLLGLAELSRYGGFWEGRFKAQRITDEAGLLACCMYVDLNPIRAAMAATPEDSVHTSAYDRIQALKGEQIDSAAADLAVIRVQGDALEDAPHPRPLSPNRGEGRKKNGGRILRDAWLAVFTVDERKASGIYANKSGVRASDKGFLPMSLADYLSLLDWTGRQGRPDKRGAVPDGLKPILQRLGIESSMWCDLVWNFKKYFGKSAGRPASMRNEAERSGRAWSRGQRAAASCFAVS